MEKFIINGGSKLKGAVNISGAKNAAVAIIPAAILADGPCVLENVPKINDVTVCLQILTEMGAKVRMRGKNTIQIDAKHIRDTVVPYEMARSIRASYYFMGALLTKFNHAKVSMPGGCALGDRPIDQHLKCFKALGANYSIEHGMVEITADKLIGTQIYFDKITVGATINAMLAAVKVDGLTILENAAKEPHIVDLANFLNSMGADIMGAGTDVIKIRGVKQLSGANYAIIPDQIEAGTYMVAAAATGGDVTIKNIIPKHLEPITSKLIKMGVVVEEYDDSMRVVGASEPYERMNNLKTMPHPGFPTDMQPQFAALLTLSSGTSIITESIYEDRFRYVDELRRMGADISVDGKVAVIEGVEKLTGAPVKAADLRAGAALIIAGLCAKGRTEIEDIYHIERGYEDMERKLRAIGADIVKRKYPDPDTIRNIG
ncbi:MAG: UDP-N-acetylglucosamine 1-carboxyvinyltransferase [Oscillospiraceae bacterium]|nr:UDP-N-acetylglucosamine 1-carboxyvinyltransferase [Oscillospiraceae bacterium]